MIDESDKPTKQNPVDRFDLKTLLARLSRHAFASFIVELFADTEKGSHEGLYPLREVGEDVFYHPHLDSYGGSIHTVYLLHFPPLELFHPSVPLTMHDPVLIQQVVRVRNIYKGRRGQWGMVSPYLRQDEALKAVGFVTNLFGIERVTYQDLLIPAYQRLKRYCGLKRPAVLVGSCDSFIDLVPDKTQAIFIDFIRRYSDGVVISITDSGADVGDFVEERNFASGVFAETKLPFEPIIVGTAIRQRAVLAEFQSMINANSSESQLEEFIRTHYKEIFGLKYDRIETQLWLRFPDLDLTRKNRRIDVFLRNSVLNDWELFEIKRPVPVTRTYRDAPVLAGEVLNAIHQAKNYAWLLSQDPIKRHFSRQGINLLNSRTYKSSLEW